MEIATAVAFGVAVFLLISDLLWNMTANTNSPLVRVLHKSAGKYLSQLDALEYQIVPKVSNKDLFGIWFGGMLILAIACCVLLGSHVAALFCVIMTILVPRLLGDYFVDQRLRKFEREFLRFTQLVKSKHNIDGSVATLIPRCIKLLVQSSGDSLTSRRMFIRVFRASQLNKALSDAFEAEAKRLRNANVQPKSLALFMAILKAVEKSGQVGDTLNQLEFRIQSDLAIKDELRAKTAGAKWEMGFMVCVPIVSLLGYRFLMPESVDDLFTTILGQSLLALSALINAYAVHFAIKTLRVQV